MYSILTFMSLETGAAGPSFWPKPPNKLARTHHSSSEPPHQLPWGQDSRVVWTRSPVPLLMPGHRNSMPLCGSGAGPGMMVVTECLMLALAGPKDSDPPHESMRLVLAATAGAAMARDESAASEKSILLVRRRLKE